MISNSMRIEIYKNLQNTINSNLPNKKLRKDLIIFKIWKIKMNEWTEWGKKAKNFYFLIILNKFNNSEFTKTSRERWKQKHTSHTQVNKKKK